MSDKACSLTLECFDMDVQLKSNSLDRLGKVLGEEKTAFFDDQGSIYSYIVGTGRHCIAIVQKTEERQ